MIKSRLAVLFAVLALAGAAALQAVEPSFKQVDRADGIEWVVETPYSSAKLVVSGPGGYHLTQDFEAGDTLFLSFDDVTKSYAPYGSYSYELVLSPVLGTADRKLGEQARELGVDATMASISPISGTFKVSDGAVVDTTLVEQTAKDQQILDDLIVDGSACIGQDCVNGESFGFDTIRIKENNLRIRAVDTSSTASFPTQDWQLTFNDSSNGGQNKFALECISPGASTPFTVEGCAPSHSLYVDDGGRVGLGTNTPVADLHVKSGNTPTLRLEQDGSSGFSAQTWDVAGNEANFFVRDASNGSTLPFRVFPGAPSNALTIEASGEIGIGTTSPTTQLHIRGSDGFDGLRIQNAASTAGNDWRFTEGNGGALAINSDGATAPNEFRFDANGDLTILGDLTANGTVYMSDRNRKKGFLPVDLDSLLSAVAQLPIEKWSFQGQDVVHIGPMAQDFFRLFEVGKDSKTIYANDAVGVSLAVTKALLERVEAQEAQIQAMQARLESLDE